MAYTKEMFEQAQQIIDARREDNEAKAAGRRRLFESLEPAYKKWKTEMIDSVQSVLRAVEMSPEKAQTLIEAQKNRNLAAQQEIQALLRKNDLPPDYLETKFTCPLCEDTGVKDGKLCACQIEVLKRLAFTEAGRKSPLKFSRFEDFRLDYYSDAYDKTCKCSPRERMETILQFCREYAAEFDADCSQSILMYGETGLGKTHLSLAIAGEVIGKGYHVLYNSAQNIFNELQKERFGKTDTGGQYEAMLLECDLLVIDDLGAEFSTQFTNAALYNIINTRMNLSLPTIISTNLDLKELEERYSRRISSRLIGEYAALCFIGADVRQIKKER